MHACVRVADLWLSCTPLRLVMVSSRFCRRSRTFCTVLFLWDSGSVGGAYVGTQTQRHKGIFLDMKQHIT